MPSTITTRRRGNRSRRKSELDAARRIAARRRTWQALDELAQETGRSIQSLTEEAYGDLLKKHRRPRTLLEALRASTRQHPANDTERGIIDQEVQALFEINDAISDVAISEAVHQVMCGNPERAAAAMDQKASEYRRAISACLEARGYSVK